MRWVDNKRGRKRFGVAVPVLCQCCYTSTHPRGRSGGWRLPRVPRAPQGVPIFIIPHLLQRVLTITCNHVCLLPACELPGGRHQGFHLCVWPPSPISVNPCKVATEQRGSPRSVVALRLWSQMGSGFKWRWYLFGTTVDNLFNLSELQFMHLQNGYNNSTSMTQIF